MHKTWIELSGSAYKTNIQMLKTYLGPDIRFCSVVKSNAYGHGLKEIVKLGTEAGVHTFGVDSLDEALEVRSFASEADIFLLGYTHPDDFSHVIEHNLIQVVYTEESLELLVKQAIQQGKMARINLKLETGTNRQGATEKSIKSLIRTMHKLRNHIDFVSLSSHFANAEDIHHPEFSIYQQERFKAYLSLFKDEDLIPQEIHIACSAPAIHAPETHYSMVRIGLAQYGLWSSDSLKRVTKLSAKMIDLMPVLTWKTRIAMVKDVEAGASIGYGLSYIADRPMRIAILPVGYYDGYRRAIRGKAHVLIQGHKCRILGNICMNMCMVDISPLPRVKAHQEVTLIGRDGMHQISVEDFADWCDTINYEAVTQIGAHIPRIVI